MIRDVFSNIEEYLDKYKTAVKIIALFTVLSLMVMIYDSVRLTDDTVLVREPYDGNHNSFAYEYTVDGMEPDSIDVRVDPLAINKDEAFELMEQAKIAWEEALPGKNESVNAIVDDIVLPDSFSGGFVTAEYEIDRDDVIDSNGKIDYTGLEEDELVCITARFSCGEWELSDTVYVKVLIPEAGTAQWYKWKLMEQINAQEEDTNSPSVNLPESLNNTSITWKQKADSRWMIIIALGVFAAVLLEWKKIDDKKREEKNRIGKLGLEYPQLVEQLSLLVCAGMTIRGAWDRIIQMNSKTVDDELICNHVFVEEMIITHNEISRGVSEAKAYEQFGNRIGLVAYKRFASVLSQNLSKGTADMTRLLGEEAKEAWMIRRSNAIQLGEAAATKLLFPMMIMLGLIILVLIMPAVGMF